MYKYTTCIYFVIVVFMFTVRPIHAQDFVAEASATLKSRDLNSVGYDYRVEKLTNFLEIYDSPLSEYSGYFVAYADLYGLDYRMVPAITGVESTFGKHIPAKSYNAYGWANGEYKFNSWPQSIKHVTKTLKTKYIDRGAKSVSSIAKRYAPPSSTWGSKVKYFMSKIDTLPSNFDIIS